MVKELPRIGTVKKSLTDQQGETRQVMREIEHYNLNVSISVGYRAKSSQGIQFCQWASSVKRLSGAELQY